MTTIRTTDVDSTGGYARLAIPSRCTSPEGRGDDYSYHQVLDPGELGEGGIMAELICRKRPLLLRTLERHVDSPEILAAMDGDVVVCAAAPGVDPSRCTSAGIRAFLVRRGQSLWMDKGTWHWLPFPVREEQVTMLLIFREGTGDCDIEFRDLEEPFAIEVDPAAGRGPAPAPVARRVSYGSCVPRRAWRGSCRGERSWPRCSRFPGSSRPPAGRHRGCRAPAS